MFLPSNIKPDEKKAKQFQLRKAYKRIAERVAQKIPENLRDGVEISVQEVECGDHNCSPIDTSIIIFFPSGGRGMFEVPYESKDVTEEYLSTFFPSPEEIEAWSSGLKQGNEEKQRKEAYERIKSWVLKRIPEHLKNGIAINVRERKCGDTKCSPINTAINLLFPSNGRGYFDIPVESKDITEEDLLDVFPTLAVIEAWGRGEEVDWTPIEHEEHEHEDEENEHEEHEQEGHELELYEHRSQTGDRVKCLKGPDPIIGHARGVNKQLSHRKKSWPLPASLPSSMVSPSTPSFVPSLPSTVSSIFPSRLPSSVPSSIPSSLPSSFPSTLPSNIFFPTI